MARILGEVDIETGVKTIVQAVSAGETEYFFRFPIFSIENLQVWVDGVYVPIDTLTVQGVGETAGGSVTFAIAPDNDAVITIARLIVPSRTTDYSQHGIISSKAINDEFDKLTAQAQDGISLHDNAIHSAPWNNPDFDHALPTLTADKVIGVKTDGTGFEMIVLKQDGGAVGRFCTC